MAKKRAKKGSKNSKTRKHGKVDREFLKRPVFWLIAIGFAAAAGLAAVEIGKSNYEQSITGAIIQIEQSLNNAELVSCTTQQECPMESECIQGYCVLTLNSDTNYITGKSVQQTSSCKGYCGGSAGSCYCDNECAEYGDCCLDYNAACGRSNAAETREISESLLWP